MLFRKRKRAIQRILIVEDEPLVAFDSEHFLSDAGFTVVATVDTVTDAIRTIQADGIDLVLADVRLSDGGNGIDVAHAAKEKGIPLLFVSGTCPLDAQAVAVGCLAKPYNQRHLLDAIAAIAARQAGEAPKRIPPGLTLYGQDQGQGQDGAALA